MDIKGKMYYKGRNWNYIVDENREVWLSEDNTRFKVSFEEKVVTKEEAEDYVRKMIDSITSDED